MAARHLAEEFPYESEDEYQSAYATVTQGKHLRKPTVSYVPTIPEEYEGHTSFKDVQADEKARTHVEEIYRELSVSHTIQSREAEEAEGLVLRNPRLSPDLLPGFGPPQSQLAEYVPDIASVPSDWNETASEGVFARHQSASATLVLDQQSLHGLRRRISSKDHGQVDVAIERSEHAAFGYFTPNTTMPGEGSLGEPMHRKGFLGVIADFFCRLFRRGGE